MRSGIFCIAMLSCLSFGIKAQQADSLQMAGDVIIGRQIEHLEVLSEAGVDLGELTEGLEYLLEQPLNLNDADSKDLRRLVFLSDVQIKNLLDYRKKYGTFLSIYELRVIDGLGRNTLQKIMPFVVVAPPREKAVQSRSLLYGKHDLIFRFQRKLISSAGYREASDSVMLSKPGSFYLGDPSRLYLRYRYRVRNSFSTGFLVEKDPGEEIFNKRYGPDFYSFHISYETKGVLKNIILGDYHARFGQGLVIWSGLSFSGGSSPSSLKRYAPGLRPNTSANENAFFRGGAVTLGINSLNISMLYSLHRSDANIVFSDSNDSPEYVSSMPNSGYHRTMNELEDKDMLQLQHLGGHISYSGGRFRLGGTICHSKYGLRLERQNDPSGIFQFSGKESLTAGINFDILLRRTSIFGELAANRNGGWALLAGMIHTTDNGSIFGLLLREYKPQFQNLLAGASGRRDHNTNEKGIRISMELPLFKRLSMQASCDQYAYPWLTRGHVNMMRGQEVQVRLSYTPSMVYELSAKYKYRSSTDNSDYLQGWFDQMVRVNKHELQLVVRTAVSGSFSAKLQAAYTLTKGLEEGYESAGSLLLLDMYYHPATLPLKLTFRYALFHTDDYMSRLYAYENDLLYASSMPAYYGKGFRFYLLAKYSPARWLDTWLRFSMTCFSDRDIISSGPDEIKNNKLPEIKFQVRIKL